MNHPLADLEAYYDGELDPGQTARIEEHLKSCPLCWQELDSLKSLSALLQTAPPPQHTAPAETSAAQVESRLPARSMASGWQRSLEMAWRLAPVVLVAGWLLFQALSLLVLIFENSGLVDTLGLGRLPEFFFFQGLPALALLLWSAAGLQAFPGADWLAALIAPGLWNLALTLLVGAGLWAWAASWWVYQNRSFTFHPAGAFSLKHMNGTAGKSIKGNENGSL